MKGKDMRKFTEREEKELKHFRNRVRRILDKEPI